MSTGTEKTIGGKYDEVAGKVKQSIGEATHNDRLANEGTAQQIKGHGEQAVGSVQSAAADAHEQKAHSVRESLTSTSQNVRDGVQRSAENLRSENDR